MTEEEIEDEMRAKVALEVSRGRKFSRGVAAVKSLRSRGPARSTTQWFGHPFLSLGYVIQIQISQMCARLERKVNPKGGSVAMKLGFSSRETNVLDYESYRLRRSLGAEKVKDRFSRATSSRGATHEKEYVRTLLGDDFAPLGKRLEEFEQLVPACAATRVDKR